MNSRAPAVLDWTVIEAEPVAVRPEPFSSAYAAQLLGQIRGQQPAPSRSAYGGEYEHCVGALADTAA